MPRPWQVGQRNSSSCCANQRLYATRNRLVRRGFLLDLEDAFDFGGNTAWKCIGAESTASSNA